MSLKSCSSGTLYLFQVAFEPAHLRPSLERERGTVGRDANGVRERETRQGRVRGRERERGFRFDQLHLSGWGWLKFFWWLVNSELRGCSERTLSLFSSHLPFLNPFSVHIDTIFYSCVLPMPWGGQRFHLDRSVDRSIQ